jgi:hypothetical protein
MFEELENKGMLDQMLTDWIIFKYEHRVWINQFELWRKFIRS